MSSTKKDEPIELNFMHRLPGIDEKQEEGGLIIKKKIQAPADGDQLLFKVPSVPPSSSGSLLGLDKLAYQKRNQQSNSNSSKRSKTSTDDEYDHDSNRNGSQSRNKERHIREQRVETPSSTRSSHHEYYNKSRPVPKQPHRGLAYGNEDQKQSELIEF